MNNTSDIQYYVLRNKNTGLYFRGKGVNRWGQYLNQASIYRIRGQAESSMEEISRRGEEVEVVPIRVTEEEISMEGKRLNNCFLMDNLHKEIKNCLLQIIAQQNINLCCNGNNCDICPYDGENCVEERLAEAIIKSGLFGPTVFNASTALLLNASQPRIYGPQTLLYHASSEDKNDQ